MTLFIRTQRYANTARIRTGSRKFQTSHSCDEKSGEEREGKKKENRSHEERERDGVCDG